MARAQQYRERFIFWLDLHKDEEFAIAECVHGLKKRRKYSRTIRDGIRLIVDLRAGRVDVLRELFPWVFDAVARHLEAERDANAAAIQGQLARLETLLLDQHQPTAPPAGPRALNAPPIPAPVFDDDDDTVLDIRAVQDGDSAANFVDSVMRMVE